LKLPGYGALLLAAARAGYAARGFVYINVGVIALLAALHLRPHAEGSRESMTAVAAAPMGSLWLGLVALGLLGFALWRQMQAVFDADRAGRTAPALVKRFGQGVSGVIYAGLAFSLLEIIDELGDLKEPDDQAETLAKLQWLMGLPYGQAVLLGAGLAVLFVAAANVVHGAGPRFRSDLDCSDRLRRLAQPIGRGGYVARGVAFALSGFYLVRSGLTLRASDMRAVGGALQALDSQPGGAWLLAVIAVGLVAFGVFGLIEARYRFLRPPAFRRS
jgi:hypothetical protein